MYFKQSSPLVGLGLKFVFSGLGWIGLGCIDEK